MAGKPVKHDFSRLVAAIGQVNENLKAQAARAVNVSLTLRNWLIGAHIAEYELHGSDRAAYGDKLIAELAKRLNELEISNCHRVQLYRYLRFYRLYPQIVGTVSLQLQSLLPEGLNVNKKVGTVSPQLESLLPEEIHGDIGNIKVKTASLQLQFPPEKLIQRLAYSHFDLLLDIDDELKRSFYEIECIRGNWSVRELKRQIGNLYFERSGLSTDKEKLAEMVQSGVEQSEPALTVRDPYVFEFLGIKPQEAMKESDLENALLDNLQEFMLELGHGFCFEARQKRILISDTHYFVDLVFYHRILKCHVLLELKVEEFTHGNLGQLNTYVNWFRENMMSEGDNPPVGILLCTHKDHTLVKYATAGISNRLFVSRYQVELPKKEEIERFLEEKKREVTEADLES